MTLENSENPIPENNPAPNTGGKANNQTHNSKPEVAPAAASPHLPPPHTHCEITCKQEKNWWDKIKPFVEMAGVVLLGIYTGYTIKMYCANKKAAEAAKSSADTARDALIRGQRPWVGFDGNPRTKSASIGDVKDLSGIPNGRKQFDWSIDIQLENFGVSPALHTVMFYEISFAADIESLEGTLEPACPGAAGLIFNKPFSKSTQIEQRGVMIFPSIAVPNGFSFGMGADSLDALKSAYLGRTTYLLGCIAYLDQFGDRPVHHTRFCYHTFRDIGTVKAGDEMTPCSWGQYAD